MAVMKLNKENKVILKYFVLIFAAAFVAINWDNISWVFNYKAVSGIISSQFQSNITAKTSEIAGEILKKNEKPLPLKDSEPTDKENSLEVPKIEVLAPVIFPESGTSRDLYKLLDSGTVYFPGSALPGEAGQTIILGHSAPENWPKIKYDWVFTRISELTEGDEIFIYFNHRKYVYHVTGKVFLDRGEELPQPLTKNQNMLVLISCWPPGKDLQRIAVLAE